MGIVQTLSRRVFGSSEKTLATGKQFVGMKPIPMNRTGEEKVLRIDPLDLETIYIRDGLVYNGINTISKVFLSSTPRIVTPDSDVRDWMDEFLSRSHFRHLLYKIVQHMHIYGNAFVEKVMNEDRTRIVSLDLIDPKRFDFLRDEQNEILYDETGKPVGYVLIVSYDFNFEKEGIPEERRVSSGNNQQGILFEPDEILHFTLNTAGDSALGIGVIEPIYNIIKIKMNIEVGLGNWIYRKGNPIMIVKVGNEEHAVSEEEITDVAEKLIDIDSMKEFVGPWYYDFEYLESKKPDKFVPSLDYFVNQMIAGLGIPKSYISGLGEDANKATLEKQNLVFERSIKMIQEMVGSIFERDLFPVLAEQEGWSDTPRFEWQEISTDTLSSKIDRLKAMAEVGLIRPDRKIESVLRRLEKLPPLDDEEESTVEP